jgi:hypothetical protein
VRLVIDLSAIHAIRSIALELCCCLPFRGSGWSRRPVRSVLARTLFTKLLTFPWVVMHGPGVLGGGRRG